MGSAYRDTKQGGIGISAYRNLLRKNEIDTTIKDISYKYERFERKKKHSSFLPELLIAKLLLLKSGDFFDIKRDQYPQDISNWCLMKFGRQKVSIHCLGDKQKRRGTIKVFRITKK